MLDRHEAHDAGNGAQSRRDASEGSLSARPMVDREVPLPGTGDESATAVHQWLDGELSEADARNGDAKGVEFWSRMSQETERRRRMTTPVHVAGRIMAALPDREVQLHAVAADALPSRTNGITKSHAVAIGAGFFTLGVVVGKMFSR
jgi:hypothetical protein